MRATLKATMPKKTKQAKIVTDSRRIDYRFIPVSVSPAASHSQESTIHINAIGRDLVKTIILAGVAITVEIVLYVILR